jgi:methyl-accepting chemotaxis protein/ABC-type amino acid transport substrate-binding protein
MKPKASLGSHFFVWGLVCASSFVVLAASAWSLHSDLQAAPVASEAAWQRLMWFLLVAAVLVGVALMRLHRSVARQLGASPNALNEHIAHLSAGKLTPSTLAPTSDSNSALAAIYGLRDSLAEKIGRVRQEAETVARESVTFSSNNLDLASNMSQQTELLHQSRSHIGSLLDTVQQAGSKTADSQKSVRFASDIATQGNEVVSKMTHTMDALSESSGKIEEIIGVIDGIAFQTNILALNAAVEAARAGEQGKGFAVVASEVRTLAQRSASAAKEIKTLIAGSVEKIAQSAKLADQVANSMDEINASSQQVTHMMEEIAAVTQQQERDISQLSSSLDHLDAVTGRYAELLHDASVHAETLQTRADRLRYAAAAFHVPGLPPADALPELPIARASEKQVARPAASSLRVRQGPGASAAQLAQLAHSVQLIVGTAHEPPLNYTDVANKHDASGADVKGFSPDVVREILARTGHQAEVRITSWERSYAALQTEPNAVLFTMARTPSRENQFHWVGPLVHSNAVLFVKRGSGISVKSLYEARKLPSIAVIKGDSKEEFLKGKDFRNLDYSPDWATAFRKLLEGKVTALVMTDMDLPTTASDAGLNPADFEPVYELFVNRLYIGMSKRTDQAVVRSWQEALDAMKRDGSFNRLAQQWSQHWGAQWVVRDGAVQAQ